jgi:hypothetical protein
VYAQWLALFCTSGLCVTSDWTDRLSARGAWIGSWLIAVFLAGVFSNAAWLAAPVLGISDGSGSVTAFVLETMFTVGLVAALFFATR